jgi:hypothetical protein
MSSPLSDLNIILQTLEPVLNPGTYAFVSVPDEKTLTSAEIVASIREPEGLSAIIAESEATSRGIPVLFRAAWITLGVHSDLQAVGLTAACSAALSKSGISCNIVARAHHDHIFMPETRAAEAMPVLKELQRRARSSAAHHEANPQPLTETDGTVLHVRPGCPFLLDPGPGMS